MKILVTLTSLLSIILLQTAPFQAKVIGITDGDTITVLRGYEEIRIRLAGIDCPENGAEFSSRAKRFTADLLAGKEVEVRPKELDPFRRLVARVIVNEQDASEALARAGLAWHDARYSDDVRLSMAQEEAKASDLGIWSLPNPIPPWEKQEAQSVVQRGRDIVYRGNAKSKVFHSPSCRYYSCKNCTVVFRSREEAIRAGYRPGGHCRP